MRDRPAFRWPTAYSGHSPSKMACHERSSRFADGKRELSRMVEAAGVETKGSEFSNLLMARDF